MVPGVCVAKLFKNSVVPNYEQTETEKLGEGFLAKKVNYATSVFDKSTRVVRNVRALRISTDKDLKFKIGDIVTISDRFLKNVKWEIVKVETQPHPQNAMLPLFILDLEG